MFPKIYAMEMKTFVDDFHSRTPFVEQLFA